MKIGPFRLRTNQLRKLGLAVCDVNYERHMRTPKENRVDTLKKYIVESVRYSPH